MAVGCGRSPRYGWSEPPAELTLERDAVHVWLARLDEHAALVERCRDLLAAEEIARAERLRFPIHRERFVIRRAMVRQVLAGYLGAAPEALRFRENERGKPSLEAGAGRPPLRFNASESAGVALLAVGRGRELGIDVERIYERPAEEKIPERFFAPGEVKALRSLPRAAQRDAFFRCWTRKEAYVKARGEGLSVGLDRFEVSLEPERPALVRSAAGPGETARWILKALPPVEGFASCLAHEAPEAPLRCWEWRP